MPTSLEIEVKTRGAESAADGLRRLAVSADEAGRGARNLGKEAETAGGVVDQLGSRSGQAKDLIEGLEAASKRGAAGIFGAFKAIRAIVEGFKINPFSFFLGSAIALGPVLLELGAKLLGVRDDTENVTGEFTKAKTAAEVFAKVKLTALDKELLAIKTRAESTLAVLEKLAELEKRSNSAAQTAELNAVKNNPKLTAEQKAQQTFQINEKYTAIAARNEDELRAGKLNNAGNLAGQLSTAASSDAGARDAQQSRVDEINRAREDRRKEIADLERELVAPQKRTPGSFISPEAAQARIARQDEIRAKLEDLRIKDQIAQSPGAKAGEKNAQDILASLTLAAEKSGAAANAARAAFEALLQLANLEAEKLPAIRKQEATNRAVEAGQPVAAEPASNVGGSITAGNGEVRAVNRSTKSSISRNGEEVEVTNTKGNTIKIGDQEFTGDAQKISAEIRASVKAAKEVGESVVRGMGAVREVNEATSRQLESQRKQIEKLREREKNNNY